MSKDILEARLERVIQHDERTRSQADWYCKRANENKRLFQAIGILVIILGAVVCVIPLFGDGENPVTILDILVSIIGALIVILKGIERIWLPEEKWTNYRKASEALLREREKYIERISPYYSERDEDFNYRQYVERCILIKAEEQNNFWGINSESEEKTAPRPTVKDA